MGSNVGVGATKDGNSTISGMFTIGRVVGDAEEVDEEDDDGSSSSSSSSRL